MKSVDRKPHTRNYRYVQLIDQIEAQIESGYYRPGDRLILQQEFRGSAIL